VERLDSLKEAPVIRTSRTAESVKVTFALPLDLTAGRCSVVGDFNEWLPGTHELRRRGNGTRSASVTVPRGTRLRFRYLGENGNWFNDPDIVDQDGSDTVVVV
jgi:1,4-alpha-glucan branching enzyme